MKKLLDSIKKNPHLAITVPALLCFITFITNLFHALKDGNIDANEYHQLLATADGFEAVVLFLIMFAINNKKK